MNQHTAGSEHQEKAIATEISASAPALPTPRHEVEPTVPYAIVAGPGRDMFRFYHVEASPKDINGLWASSEFCVSNLVWVHDHFIVTPNPRYLNPSSALVERFAKILRVLLNWYSAKRLVASLNWPVE